MKDKLVNWGNKAARLQIGIDMNTINISMSRLEEQLEVEKGIVKALEEAKEKENEADIISELLHHTGEFYQADRCYIFYIPKRQIAGVMSVSGVKMRFRASSFIWHRYRVTG